MKLYWIHGKYAEDFWITTAKSQEDLLEKYVKEFGQSVEYLKENGSWEEISKIDGFEILLKKTVKLTQDVEHGDGNKIYKGTLLDVSAAGNGGYRILHSPKDKDSGKYLLDDHVEDLQ